MKGLVASFKVWFLNSLDRLKWSIRELVKDLREDDNHSLRIFVFVVIYILFSAVGAYNFAHLTAFLYIVWLLEQRHGN